MCRNGSTYFISNSIASPDSGVDSFTYGRAADTVYADTWAASHDYVLTDTEAATCTEAGESTVAQAVSRGCLQLLDIIRLF